MLCYCSYHKQIRKYLQLHIWAVQKRNEKKKKKPILTSPQMSLRLPIKGKQQRNNTKAIGSDKEACQKSQITRNTRARLRIQAWISKNLLWDFSQGASVCRHDLPQRVKHNEEKIRSALVDPHYFDMHCFLIPLQVNWGGTNPAPQTSGTECPDPYKQHVHQPMRAAQCSKGKRASLSIACFFRSRV